MSVDYFNISSMKIEDIEDIMVVENLCFTIPWSKESFIHELINDKLTRYICARAGNKAIAYIGMWKIYDEGHVTNIAVHPQYRRKGIGGKLISHLISIAQKEKIEKMTLEVRKSNIAAQKLYIKNGFEIKGVRKKYYSDNGEDAIIMWKNNI